MIWVNKLKDPQQINFISKLSIIRAATMFFIIEKSIETINNGNTKDCKFIRRHWQWKLKIYNKKWYIIDGESNDNYSDENEIKFLTSSLESNLWDYSDAYILVTGNINVTGGDANTKVAIKNYAPFRKCRTEINETSVDDAQP